jgi:hypothetical protein
MKSQILSSLPDGLFTHFQECKPRTFDFYQYFQTIVIRITRFLSGNLRKEKDLKTTNMEKPDLTKLNQGSWYRVNIKKDTTAPVFNWAIKSKLDKPNFSVLKKNVFNYRDMLFSAVYK